MIVLTTHGRLFFLLDCLLFFWLIAKVGDFSNRLKSSLFNNNLKKEEDKLCQIVPIQAPDGKQQDKSGKGYRDDGY